MEGDPICATHYSQSPQGVILVSLNSFLATIKWRSFPQRPEISHSASARYLATGIFVPTTNLLPSLSMNSVGFITLPATARPAQISQTDDREMSDPDNTVKDISSPRADMTRTRPINNPRAPGSYIVWWRRNWGARHKQCPPLPALKTSHGISNCVIPKRLSCLYPLTRPYGGGEAGLTKNLFKNQPRLSNPPPHPNKAS